MELRQLQHLVALADRLNYTKASEDVGLSQSALTRSIQALEREVGMQLFDRSRRGVRLTEPAREIVVQARAVLSSFEGFRRKLQKTSRAEIGSIKFGMAPLPARALLGQALTERISQAPGLENEAIIRNVRALWSMLMDGEIEFFVSAEGQVPQAHGVRVEVLGSFATDLLVREGHPLLGERGESSAFPLLVANRWPQSSVSAGLPEYLRPIHVIESYEAMVHVALGSDAVCLASVYAVQAELRSGSLKRLREPKLLDRKPRFAMYSLYSHSQSPAALEIKSILKKSIRELQSDNQAP